MTIIIVSSECQTGIKLCGTVRYLSAVPFQLSDY